MGQKAKPTGISWSRSRTRKWTPKTGHLA